MAFDQLRPGKGRNRNRGLSVTEHLALYTTFHQGRGNKLLHAVFVPLIFFTGALFFSCIGISPAVNAATLVALLVCALHAQVDAWGAVALGAWLVPLCGLAGLAVDVLPWSWVLTVAAGAHALAWILTVCVGHNHLEPLVTVEDGAEDSNLYFRRSYFAAGQLGVAVTWKDRFIQFCIAPLSLTHDLLVWIGLRSHHEQRISIIRERILTNLSL